MDAIKIEAIRRWAAYPWILSPYQIRQIIALCDECERLRAIETAARAYRSAEHESVIAQHAYDVANRDRDLFNRPFTDEEKRAESHWMVMIATCRETRDALDAALAASGEGE